MDNALAEDLSHILDHTRELWAEVRGERVFLTGGTGFVGSWLTESLLWANRRLSLGMSAVLLTRRPEAFQRRSPHLADDPAVHLLRGDTATFEFPAGSFPLVIHAATERSFDPDAARPSGIFEANVAATRRVLEFAATRGAARFLLTSSGAVYGKQPPEMTHIPEDYTGAPSTVDVGAIYGHSKRVSEFLCSSYARVYGFSTAIARLFAFVGPYLPLDENYAVGNFVRDALAGGPVRIGGDGTPFRSYLYGADLAIWLWTILLRGRSAVPYNVGSPDALTILNLAERVRSIIAPEAQIVVAQRPVEGAPPLRYVPSVERAERELALRPWIPLEEGIRRMGKWSTA